MTLLQWFALLFCGSVGVFTVLLFWCCCVLAGRADRAGGWVEEDTLDVFDYPLATREELELSADKLSAENAQLRQEIGRLQELVDAWLARDELLNG